MNSRAVSEKFAKECERVFTPNIQEALPLIAFITIPSTLFAEKSKIFGKDCAFTIHEYPSVKFDANGKSIYEVSLLLDYSMPYGFKTRITFSSFNPFDPDRKARSLMCIRDVVNIFPTDEVFFYMDSIATNRDVPHGTGKLRLEDKDFIHALRL